MKFVQSLWRVAIERCTNGLNLIRIDSSLTMLINVRRCYISLELQFRIVTSRGFYFLLFSPLLFSIRFQGRFRRNQLLYRACKSAHLTEPSHFSGSGQAYILRTFGAEFLFRSVCVNGWTTIWNSVSQLFFSFFFRRYSQKVDTLKIRFDDPRIRIKISW